MAIMSMQMDVTSRAKNSKGGKVRNASTASKSHYISRTGRYAPTPKLDPKPAPTGGGENAPKTADKLKYNSRKDQFADRHADEIVFKGSGNMPKWAKKNPQEDDQHYWDACDKYERDNGRLSRNFILALPRELSDAERLELTEGFCEEIARTKAFGRLPFSFAIHQDKDNHNPHAHIMISERVNDGIPRNASTWFKRSNSKNPADGGAVKTQELKTIQWLHGTRRKWADYCNTMLEGRARIDHRSLKEQGIKQLPMIHVGKTKYMDEKSIALGLSTPFERTQHNEKIKELNTLYRDSSKLLNTMEQPKDRIPKTIELAMREHFTPDHVFSPRLPKQARLQSLKHKVHTKSMIHASIAEFMRYIQKICDEIMDNQSRIWANEIALLQEQTERLKEQYHRMEAQRYVQVYTHVATLFNRPQTLETLLLTNDQRRDRFFKKIGFSERHITHGDFAKVQSTANTESVKTSASQWAHEIEIAELFVSAMLKKSGNTPAKTTPLITRQSLMAKLGIKDKVSAKQQPPAPVFTSNTPPPMPVPPVPKQVTLSELAEQEQARKDRMKNNPVFVDMDSPLKPKLFMP